MVIKAVFFDMDGVLVDSERYFISDAHKFFEVLMPGWKKEDFAKISGKNAIDIHEVLTQNHGLEIDFDSYMVEATKFMKPIYQERTVLLPGVKETLARLKEQGILVALASSSLQICIEIVIDRFKLEFDTVVSAEDVEKGKPAPDIFLQSAANLGVKPDECVVIEDSKNGVTAAKAAGMRCISFRADYNGLQDLSQADVEITDLTKIPEIISTF